LTTFFRIFFCTIIISFFWCKTALAQEDTLPLFRNNNTIANQHGVKNYKNTVFLNFSTLLRGGVSLGYEKYFTFSGIAVNAQAGYTARDFTGQYAFINGNSIFHNDESFKGGKKPGYMYELGVKYYFEKLNEGYFISGSFFNVVNTRVRELSTDFLYANLNGKSYLVDYKSREIKLMYGKSNEADSKFYTDIAFGAGMRFLKYDKMEFTTLNEPTNEPYFKYIKWANKRMVKDIKLWLYFTCKIGLRY